MGNNILTRELLLKSVAEWNAAREAYPDLKPDLSEVVLTGACLIGINFSKLNFDKANLNGANLSNANFNGANLRSADLRKADLSRADLGKSNLSGAKLNKTNLNGANLRGAVLREADFSRADLSKAHLNGAILSGATLYRSSLYRSNLSEAILSGSILTRALVGFTSFGDVDLSAAIGLDTIIHKGPSTIGVDTIYLSKGNIPEVFLRGCGVPDNFIENIRSLTASAIDFYSCFISYSTKDDDFARRIHNDLQAAGVRCWFAPHDIQGGKKVLHQIEEAIRLYDKLLLILSPDSMNSNWVETEIINAIKKEKQQQKQVLFPISIAPFEEIKQWKRFDADSGRDLAREIREYHIPDFSLWGSDQDAYKTAFDRLLKDLKQ